MCECGCGLEVSGYNTNLKQPHRYIHGHNQRGKHNLGVWKGENVGLEALHVRLRKLIPKPNSCPTCGLVKRLVLCNISRGYNSKTYNMDIRNWFWACQRCHMIYDEFWVRKDIKEKKIIVNVIKRAIKAENLYLE